MVVILDYGVGNMRSIYNILKKIGVPSKLGSSEADVRQATKLILPGVGHFDYCMNKFRESGLREIVEEKIFHNATPLLGVCVGCQMLFEHSDEGDVPGLGWLKGRVVRFREDALPAGYKVPHMGWTDVNVVNGSVLYRGIDEPRFYFVHSYHIADCDKNDISATVEYGYTFTASVEKNNIMGVQFHPEKSHRFGMKLYANFIQATG